MDHHFLLPVCLRMKGSTELEIGSQQVKKCHLELAGKPWILIGDDNLW